MSNKLRSDQVRLCISGIKSDEPFKKQRRQIRFLGFAKPCNNPSAIIYLTPRSFELLTVMALYRYYGSTDGGWINKYDLCPSGYAAKYIYRLRSEIKAGLDDSTFDIIENDLEDNYRIRIRRTRIHYNPIRLREYDFGPITDLLNHTAISV